MTDERACIYVFSLKDGRSADRRRELAARHYLRASGRPCPGPFPGIRRTEQGKPYFPGSGMPCFSITHSGDFWICVLFPASIGIDLQKHTRKQGEAFPDAVRRFGRMAVRFFHPEEASWVTDPAKQAPSLSYRRFFDVWAAKESYVKYTGTGIDSRFGNFSTVSSPLPASPASGAQVDPALPFSWQAAGAWFCQVPFLNGCSLCLCTDRPAVPVLCLQFFS